MSEMKSIFDDAEEKGTEFEKEFLKKFYSIISHAECAFQLADTIIKK